MSNPNAVRQRSDHRSHGATGDRKSKSHDATLIPIDSFDVGNFPTPLHCPSHGATGTGQIDQLDNRPTGEFPQYLAPHALCTAAPCSASQRSASSAAKHSDSARSASAMRLAGSPSLSPPITTRLRGANRVWAAN